MLQFSWLSPILAELPIQKLLLLAESWMILFSFVTCLNIFNTDNFFINHLRQKGIFFFRLNYHDKWTTDVHMVYPDSGVKVVFANYHSPSSFFTSWQKMGKSGWKWDVICELFSCGSPECVMLDINSSRIAVCIT